MKITNLKILSSNACSTGWIVLCVCFNLQAQIGIGVENPAVGTLLHIEDVDGREKSGVLFPKVALTDLNFTQPLPEDIKGGTIVYNTNAGLQTGYFYWTVTKWQRLNFATGSMAKFVNSNQHTDNNLNSPGGTEADIFGLPSTDPAFLDDPALYQRPAETVSTDPINRRFLYVRQSGRYQITVNLSLGADPSNTGLSEIEARLAINDTEVGPYYRSSEMNAAVSSTKGSISFTQTLYLPANTKLSVVCRRASNSSGNVYLLEGGSSSFFIEKLI